MRVASRKKERKSTPIIVFFTAAFPRNLMPKKNKIILKIRFVTERGILKR